MKVIFTKILSFCSNQTSLAWRVSKTFIEAFLETPYQIASSFQRGRSLQEAFGNALRWFFNPVSHTDYFGALFLPEKVREARKSILVLARDCGFIKVVWEASDRKRSNIIINVGNPGQKGVKGVVAALSGLHEIASSVGGFAEKIQREEYEIALPGSEEAKRLYFRIHGVLGYFFLAAIFYGFLYFAWLFVDFHDVHGGKELITFLGASFLLLSVLRSVLMVSQVASAMKKDRSIDMSR